MCVCVGVCVCGTSEDSGPRSRAPAGQSGLDCASVRILSVSLPHTHLHTHTHLHARAHNSPTSPDTSRHVQTRPDTFRRRRPPTPDPRRPRPSHPPNPYDSGAGASVIG